MLVETSRYDLTQTRMEVRLVAGCVLSALVRQSQSDGLHQAAGRGSSNASIRLVVDHTVVGVVHARHDPHEDVAKRLEGVHSSLRHCPIAVQRVIFKFLQCQAQAKRIKFLDRR